MRYLVLAVAIVLSACTMGLGGKGGKAVAANPITGGDVTVTALSGPPGAATAGAAPVAATKPPLPNPARPHPAPAAADTAQAKPAASPAKPADAAAPVAEEPKPEPPPSSPEEAACRKKGGQWAKVGKGAGQTCVQRTRDAGKECKKASQCEGLCLARSGTCAPIAPLFGCNEILQNDGSRVTLCID
ncbi:hypothetical protein [Fuscibacter oryzae]|uniref:Uncharacterized protein n=1 Tax=Fuscibacter oryzae TaxID=2803939 RepID=A0A8J7MPR5_9RHOB|nr:hypothetical protein [Fuscibacter oryzae]MBL4927753.1 hypothetical protein [Fuscibacter oryzae]